jgi:hypothetical protein
MSRELLIVVLLLLGAIAMFVANRPRMDAVGLIMIAALPFTRAVIAEAMRLYERQGWQRVGEIPDFALLPHGGLCATVLYYRRIGA